VSNVGLSFVGEIRCKATR